MKGYRFSGFEIDLPTRELRRNGYRVPIQPQPFQILCALLDAGGEVVTRERIIELLWGDTNLANAGQSLNIAVRKLRDALDDSADEPKFIQTLARQGYRFIGQFEKVELEKPVVDAVPVQELPPPVVRSAALPWRLAAAAILVVAAAAGGLWWWNRGQPWDLKSKDLVLVAKFTDTTGETSLEGSFEALLEAELANAGGVIPVSQERIGDTLRLMRRPHDSRPGLSDAIEVCRRDLAIRAVVGGDVRKIGSKYVLAVRLLSPVSGTVLAGFTRDATERTGLVAVLRALSSSVQERLGGERTQQFKVLDRVTTASLQALKLYSDGHAMGRKANWPAAEILFREAVKLDPGFASAQLFLAWAIFNQDAKAFDKFMPPAERALSLADVVSEEEALFIRGSFRSFQGDHAGAVPIYEALLQRYPQHHWVINNISWAYTKTGQLAKLRALVRQLPELRPNDPRSYLRGMEDCFCVPGENPQRALVLAEKAAKLMQGSDLEADHRNAGLGQYFTRAQLHWLQGEARQTQMELDAAAAVAVTSVDPQQKGDLGLQAAGGYLALGQIRRSVELLDSISSTLLPKVVFRWKSWSYVHAGDSQGLARLVKAQTLLDQHPLSVMALLRVGLPEIGEGLLSRIDLKAPNILPEAMMVARGELLLHQGRLRESAATLERAMKTMNAKFPEYLLAAQALARVYDRQGRMAEAILTLREATEVPRACGGFLRAAFWPQVRFDLMELYRRTGREREADEIRKELARLLALADDHVTLKVKLVGTGG